MNLLLFFVFVGLLLLATFHTSLFVFGFYNKWNPPWHGLTEACCCPAAVRCWCLATGIIIFSSVRFGSMVFDVFTVSGFMLLLLVNLGCCTSHHPRHHRHRHHHRHQHCIFRGFVCPCGHYCEESLQSSRVLVFKQDMKFHIFWPNFLHSFYFFTDLFFTVPVELFYVFFFSCAYSV